MDNNRPPSNSDDIIRQTHQQVAKAADDAQHRLERLLSPARSAWSPAGTQHSTSTAYSNTASNATAMDFSTRTGISPMAFSPATRSGSAVNTARGLTPTRRRSSPHRGPVLTQETRSRPTTRRSDIAASIKRLTQAPIEAARSASPATALTPGGVSAVTARSIPNTPESTRSGRNLWTAVGNTPSQGTRLGGNPRSTVTAMGISTPQNQGLPHTGITPVGRPAVDPNGRQYTPPLLSPRPPATRTTYGRPSSASSSSKASESGSISGATPGSRNQSQKSAKGTPARVNTLRSAKSTRTALGRTPMGPGTPLGRSLSQNSTNTAVGATPGASIATPNRSTITAIPPGTPGSRFSTPGGTPGRNDLSQRSAKSTKTAIGTPGGAPRSTATAVPRGTPATPGGALRSTATAVPPNTPTTPGPRSNISQRSAKSTKTAVGATPGRLNTPASARSTQTALGRTPLGPGTPLGRSMTPTNAAIGGTLNRQPVVTPASAPKSTVTAMASGTPGTPGGAPKSTITAILPGTPGTPGARGNLSQRSAKSSKTAIGTPGGAPRSTVTAVPPNTPATPGNRSNLSQRSAKSTKTAVGTPGGAPRSTITAVPPNTPATPGPRSNLSQRSAKSTKTAIGTPGGPPRSTATAMLNTPQRCNLSQKSSKSAKSTKTALATPIPASIVPSPLNTPASTATALGANQSQRSAKSTNTALKTPGSQRSLNTAVGSTPLMNTPRRPVETRRPLRRTPQTPAGAVSSTTTAITPNGASTRTARSIPSMTHMGTAWTPSVAQGASNSPGTTTARELTAPLAQNGGFRAARSTSRGRNVPEPNSTRTAKETRPHEKTLGALHSGGAFGRSRQNILVDSSPAPLQIIETTSFTRTPTRSEEQSMTNTAVPPPTNNLSWKSPKKSGDSMATAITPGGLSARTALSIAEKTTPKSARKSTTTAITPGGISARTARPISESRTPKTAKPATDVSTRTAKSETVKKSIKGVRASLLPKLEVNIPTKSAKSARSRKSQKASAKSQKAVKSKKGVSQKSNVSKVSKKTASTARSFQPPGTPSTACEIDQEMLDEAKGQNNVLMTSALPDGSFKVTVQVSVKAAAGGRVHLKGKAPQGMVTQKVTVNGANIYQA